MKNCVCIICLLLITNIIHAQNDCASLHEGVHYFYPKNSTDRYTEYMENGLEHELNTTIGDTVLWSIKWKNDCEYECSYVAGSVATDDKTNRFLKKHTLVYVIETVTPDYYLFKGYVDTKKNNQPVQVDTMWLHEKTRPGNSSLFQPLTDTTLITQQYFSDTAQYALLYVFRPGKLVLILATNLLYLDDNALCLSKNNTGYVFKILKEGNYTLHTSILKDSVQLPVNIKFGNRYYVKSDIHWRVTNRLYNFRLELSAMDAVTGSKEFSEVKIRP